MKETVASKIRLVQITALVIFIILITLLSGCIGGKSVSANSSGRVISSSELIRQPNGIYKIKPTKAKSVKSRPVTPQLPAAKPTHAPSSISAAGKPEPFKPTIKEAKLSPAEVLIENLKNGEPPTTIGKGENWCGTKNPEIAGPCEAEPKVKINWIKLIQFYLGTALFIALLYWGFKIARKKTENMIEEERKNAAKKAPKKRASKRTAKKRK